MISYITTLNDKHYQDLVLFDNQVFDGIALASNYIMSVKGFSAKAKDVIIKNLEKVDNTEFLNLVLDNGATIDKNMFKALDDSTKLSSKFKHAVDRIENMFSK